MECVVHVFRVMNIEYRFYGMSDLFFSYLLFGVEYRSGSERIHLLADIVDAAAEVVNPVAERRNHLGYLFKFLLQGNCLTVFVV